MTKRNLDAAFPSRYLRSPDVEGKHFTATVKSVEYEKMADGKEKPVAYFKGMRKNAGPSWTRTAWQRASGQPASVESATAVPRDTGITPASQ